MCTHAHNHTVCSHVHLSLLSCAAPVCPFVPQDLEHGYCPCPVKTQMCLTRVLLALSSLTLFCLGGQWLEFLVTSFPKFKTIIFKSFNGWMKKEGDTHMNLRIGLFFVKDLDQRSIDMLSVNPTRHTRFGRDGPGTFVCLFPLSVW